LARFSLALRVFKAPPKGLACWYRRYLTQAKVKTKPDYALLVPTGPDLRALSLALRAR
jgi:hypothetical protein